MLVFTELRLSNLTVRTFSIRKFSIFLCTCSGNSVTSINSFNIIVAAARIRVNVYNCRFAAFFFLFCDKIVPTAIKVVFEKRCAMMPL